MEAGPRAGGGAKRVGSGARWAWNLVLSFGNSRLVGVGLYLTFRMVVRGFKPDAHLIKTTKGAAIVVCHNAAVWPLPNEELTRELAPRRESGRAAVRRQD